MHSWGDPGVDFRGIGDAAYWIGTQLRRWGRMGVSTTKEKYGTARVYCMFGWYQLHSITHPGYVYSQYPQWAWSLDCRFISRVVGLFNGIVVPYQQWLYRRVYALALNKWPHLRGEILTGADHIELLMGLDINLHMQRSSDNCIEVWWTGYRAGRTDFRLREELADGSTEEPSHDQPAEDTTALSTGRTSPSPLRDPTPE